MAMVATSKVSSSMASPRRFVELVDSVFDAGATAAEEGKTDRLCL
jgi:hypothetical protein